MTSTNDGKDVKSIQTSAPKGKKYHIELYKSLEARLSSEDSLEARTGHVCDAWRRVYSLHQHSAPSTHPHLLSWLQRHTALTILQSEWQSSPIKDELHARLSAAIDSLVCEARGGELPWQRQLVARARWFRAALASPWGHPVLASLLNDPGEPLADAQVLEWLKEERGVVFVSRLRQLAASRRTDDLALALAGAVMDRARAARAPPRDDAPDDAAEAQEDSTSFYALLRRDAGFLEVWDLLTDIEFVLLHKREKRAKCIELAKQTPLRDGYHLVERLRSRLETAPRDKKLWKNAKEVATLIAQVIIARCMVLATCSGAGRTALYCCARSLARLVPPARLPAVTAALAAPAATARHLHTLCSAIHAQCAGDMKPFVCELYVRAITAGMNELERLKLNADKQAEARASEQTLASWFTQLGALLGASARLRAECALTAFSVHPAPELYERVRHARLPATVAEPRPERPAEAGSEFGSWANDSRTQSNLVKTSQTLQMKRPARHANVLSSAILTEGEALGLPPELGQDLAVLLAGPRVKTLAWDMDRELLLQNCRAHMERTHGGTRALTTELKYLNLDPSAFQHLPEEEDDENDAYYGIEKGYEHLVQLEEPEGIWQSAFFDPEQTESAAESEREERARASSADEDPLSLLAHANKQRKQARNEKSETKHRKKSAKHHGGDGSRERKKDKQTKTKKERKKKSDATPADLGAGEPAKIKDGEKRARKKKERRRDDAYTNISVTDSDYDSRGKASQVSDNNDPSVLFDGLFSMDEMKSPERRKSSEKPQDGSSSIINSSSPTVISKIINAPNPAINKTVLETVKKPTKLKSSAGSDSDVSRSRSPYLTPNQLINRHLVNDKVKKSITKLLQFRRQKNASSSKNPVASGQKSDNTAPAPVSTQPTSKHNEAPKVYLDKKQTQQLEAINNLLNVANGIKNSEQVHKMPYEESAKEYDDRLTCPQNTYNIQKQQEAMQCMSQNIVQNPNVFSDNRNTCSDYMQSSPHKQSPHINYLSNHPARSCSAIDASYLSPSKQAEKYYGLNVTPPKPESKISRPTFHKSMQNLAQTDSTKFNPPPKQLNEPRYYNQYTNNKLHDSHRLPNSSAKSTSHSQIPSNSHSSIQQQYAAMNKPRGDYVKSYQPGTDNRINASRSSLHNSKQYSSPKQLSSSMQNIHSDIHGTVSDVSRTFSAPRGPANHANTQSMSSHNDLSNAQHDTVSTDAKPDSRHNPTQYPKDKLVSNVPAKPQHVKSTPQSSEAESHTKFKDFLKELQDTINAGVSDYGSYQPINLNKQVQVTPMTPLDRPSTPNNVPNAKQTKPSKKNETAPNTFSRLSYLHKNKQSEIKSRNDSNAVNAELKSLNMNILEHKMSKAKYMKHEVTISRVPKPADSSGNVLCNLQKKNPVLSSILSSMSAETYKRPSQPGVVANSQNTSDNMTNREHADLLLLLRNQQTLKVPNNQTRVPEQNVSNKLTKSETQVPATYQRLHDNYEVPPINKKVDPAVGHNPQVAKESTKTDDDKQQDWETVMNAIRAHKTQPLGPNALEMVLKKDKKQLPSNSKSDINLKQTPLSSSSAPNNEPRKRDNQSSRSNSSALKPSLEKHGGVPKNQTEVIKKIPQVEMLKKTPQVEMPKKSEAPNKHFATNSLKRDDPFISGIPNSDYDLLEELMDDDLRQEIGELSSDEERYHAPTVMKVKRSALGSVSKVNNHVCAKVENPPKAKPHVADQKTIACKNAPNLNVPDFKCTRTTMNASSSTGYAKVIENPVLPEATSLPQNRPTVLCSNIESSHMAANIITNQSENHFIPNIAASNHIEPANLIFTSIPAQPMMLISQELVYDPYPTIRIHESQVSAGLCNVTPHAFVTLNPTPNIAVYQTTQFAAPVINPVIIGNAMTTTTNVTNTTEYQQPKPNLDKQESQPPIINSTNPVPDNLTNYSDTTADRPLHSDINMNKCSDRKVLSQMQDNNTIDNSEKDGRIRRKSLDNTSLKTKQDEERIKMKRQALMNREVNHSCFHPPIPLSYTPLREKRNLDKLIQQATPKNGAVKSTFKLRSSSTVVTKDVAANASVEIPKSKTNNENLDSSDMASSSKENQKCRRILLRSLSKLDSEIAPSKVGRVPLRRNKFKPKRTQASEKIDTHGPSVNNDKIKTDTKTPTRASIRIMNKAIATVDTTGSSSIINSGIHQDTKKKEESSEVKLNSDSGAIDFENAITGSVILTTSSDLKREVVSEIKLNKDNMAKEKTQQLLRDDKVAQISNEKPAILKETKLISGSATSSIQPDKVLEKPKSNLVVKSSVTSPASANKPIVMTIKNQNQAILSNESITTYTKERISSPACNKMTKSDVKEVKLEKTPSKAESTINKINASKPIVAKSVAKDTEAKLEIATSKSESTVSNIMNAPKPPATQNIVKNTEAKLEIAIPTSESTVTDTIAAVTPSVTRSIAKNSEAKLVSAPSKSTLTSEINVSNPPFDENDDHKKARHVNPKQNLRKVQQKDESGNQNNADDLPHKRSLGSAAPQQTRQQAVPVKVKSSANNRSLLLPVNKPLEDQKGNNNVIFLDSAILSEEKQTDSHSAKRFDVVNTVQNPETPVVGTDTTRPKKAIAKDNSTVGNSSLPKMDTQKTTDLATKNKNSQETCNNVNKNAPQYRQEDVIIEEVPITGDEDPAKKSVRITLPNGKIYKATVFGKMNIDCNTLFTDPAMKSIMTERLLEGKRYTLNINQISKASKDNPTKILDQKFCKINIKEKEIPVETVNLISDDEDDDVHSFSTEFGKFRTNINIEELNKHQRKFDQRCTVKLKRDDIFKSNRTKPKPKSFPSTPTSLLTRNKSKLASEVQNSHVKSPQVQATPIEAEDDLPPVYLNCNKVSNNDQHTRSSLLLNKDATPQENIPEIIEIDDSSSDSESKTSLNCTEPTLEPVKKIIELKNLLLKDLGVDDKNKGKPITIPIEQQVTVAEDLKSALLQDLGVAIAPPNSQEKKENSITIESKDKVDEPVHTLKKYNIKNCVVKLPTCDDLIKKFELMKNAKNCVVILQRYNYSPDVTRVIESDNSETAESNLDCNEDYIDFDVEETCSPQLSRCPSLSILNNLWDETHETENIYGRSSPVMEIFDVLVSLRNKIENTVEIDRHVENHKIWICDSEWTMTKQACRIQEIFEISYIKDTKRISLVCNDSVERPEAFTPPKLITIAFKFLEDNPDVVYRLHSIREVKKKTSLNHLKRKTEHLVDNNVACKILKLGTLVIRALNSYTKNVDKKSIVRCHDEKKHMKTDVILNEQKVSYQKRLSITEQYSFCQDYIVPNVENSECNEQNERTDDQCVNDSDLVPSNIEMDKTAENLEKTEENSVINIDESSEVSNGVISKDITECSSVNVSNVVSTVDEPEETGKEASIGPEPESVLHTEDVVAEVKASLPKNSGAIECELFGSYENAIDTEKVLSPVRICDDPNKINECPITLPQIEPMGSCNSLECQEKPFTVQTVIKPDNIHNKEVNVMTDTITVTKNKQSNELINFSPATADNENNDNPMNENVLTDDYDTDINKSIGDNAVPCENVNEKSTENNVTATNGTNTDRPNIEGPEVSSITVKDDSVNISIDRPQYETAIAVNNNDSETTQRNVSINLDGSETECNENVNAENTSQKCAALCSYDTVSFTVYCCNDLVNIEKTEQNLTTNKSVSPDIDIDPRISKLTSRSEEEMNEKALNAPLVEIPISDMPHEVYEVEIRDTNLEDDGEIQNSDAINLQSIPTSIDTSVKTNGCDSDITSPIFVDNKEIIFNYHDYTKLPKVKLAKIHDEITNAQSLTLNEGLKSTEDGNNYNNNETTVKVVNPIITTKPERKYELIQEDDWLTVITTEHDNESTADIDSGSSHVQPRDNVEDTKIVTIPDTEKAGVTLNGIEIEDPVIGTSGSSESNIPTESIENNGNTNEGATVYSNLHDAEFCVIAPKITYSKGNLKRKMDMRDHKLAAKKYRKGKNIDCSKQTVRSIIESAYSKEYKRLLEYCSSVKFSYNRPFHKECVDVADMTADWPIKTTCTDVPEDGPDVNLFIDVQTTPPYQPDPTTQTLVEEITHDYEKTDGFQDSASVEAYETNFDMGFGEGSGRVIQNLKKGGDSNISAATLSDVKQTQPVFMSEGQDNCAELSNSIKDDQIKKIRQYVSFIELRDKVRSFFKKSSSELKLELMQQNIKECGLKSRYGDRNISADFPYDLCSLEYVKPIPTETIVQVVQLGQLPVSAAAQNPVTCDPRVTQVSDASPSQCSVDNSPNDDSQSEIKTEYTELTTADLTLPLVQEYAQQNQAMNLDSHDADKLEFTEQTISLEMEIKAEETPEIKEELPDIKEEGGNSLDNADLHTLTNATPENIEYLYDNNTVKADSNNLYDSSEQNSCEALLQQRQQNGSTEKTDQIAHAMTAAGITTMSESMNNSRAHALVNIISQKIRQGSVNTTQTTTNTYSKTTSINAMSLQQALAQILPPPLNQTGTSENNQPPSAPVGPQVLHIVQGKNASGNQITLLDNSQQSVISTPNATQVLHIVQNKGATAGQTSNGALAQQPNSFSGLSLVDTGLQQGGNQLLHIVNTGNQKNANAGQLLKRVNLLTNLANVQGSNEQKMVQFVCKSADGKAIQLNAPHQRGMVLRLQPIETSNVQTPQAKPAESQELSTSPTNSACNKETASQQEIKSRSIYEENYAKFIQNSSSKTPNSEKSTSLPKFNQAFGKAVFQEGNQKQAEGSSPNSHLQPTNTHTENSECPPTDNAINLEAMRQIGSPPLLIRKPPVTTQSQPNIVQQIKQTIAPMNIQTMHGGVIYTRQIPVNIGGGQTINLITVPSTELINDESSKTQAGNQGEGEPSIIKIVPQNQNTTNAESSQEENNGHVSGTNDAPPTPQPQPVLTQMRIKLPMLSKAPQMVPGARVVRPSFFQIQRNVIGGANQPVYQQLVLTAAPPLGQQTIRLPQAQASRPIKVPSENQSSSESQMSTSTLEQLREFDMVLEQVKERSTVQPGTNSSNNFKLQNNSSDATDGTGSSNCSSESTQILYSIGNNHSLNVAYVNRKATVTTPTTSTFVRSPDSTGVADSPTSSTHSHIPHTVTSDSSPTDMTSQSKPAKVCSKSKSRPKSSSNPPNTLKLNSVPPKTSSQKPLEDEQTTQRILYILAEYKEQVENSPDKDKPAPRRRSNPPSNPGSSKRKKSSSSRRSGTRDASPVHGEDTCRTMGSEDSSCGTSQGDCNESCLDSHSPQDSPRKVARKITFDQEQPAAQPRQPQRNVIVADGQTITVARSATGKPATAVLMPTNYILPVSMMKGGQQIAIVTNRGPKLLTVGGEAGAANALLLQRLIGPGGLKPVLARPGVRHVRLPATALHNLQAFNLAATAQPPDSSAAASPAPAPPEPADARAADSPWADRDDVKPERGSSPEGSEPWNLPSSADAHEYSYEETVRTDSMERTVLVVQKKDGTHRQHRLSHVSAAALRHKYAILEHELRLQKSLSEECEDLGVDSPSASELFPEAELLFAASPAHEHAHDAHDHAPAPHQSAVPPAELDEPLPEQLLPLGDDAQLDPEEFARAHPNTTFHSEPDEVQPFTITGLKGRHITSTIFHSNGAPATVLMAAPAAVHERARLEARAEPGKDGLRFDAILADARDLRLHAPAAHAAHAAHVIRRVCYEDDKRERDARYLIDEPDSVIAGDDAEMVAEDDSRDAAPGPVADADDAGSSPERHAELFWESASTTRSEGRRPPDFSSDSDKCCKSPFDENNSTDSSGGAPARLDTVIKAARGGERGGSAGSDDAPPPLRTYPPKRLFHAEGESVSGKTRAGEAADGAESRRRASARGVVKRGCHCCGGEPPARVKKPRQRKPALDFAD